MLGERESRGERRQKCPFPCCEVCPYCRRRGVVVGEDELNWLTIRSFAREGCNFWWSEISWCAWTLTTTSRDTSPHTHAPLSAAVEDPARIFSRPSDGNHNLLLFSCSPCQARGALSAMRSPPGLLESCEASETAQLTTIFTESRIACPENSTPVLGMLSILMHFSGPSTSFMMIQHYYLFLVPLMLGPPGSVN